MDNSLQNCYKERQSCLDRDMIGEVNLVLNSLHLTFYVQISHLYENVFELLEFGKKWWQIPGDLEHKAVEGELS